MNTQIPEWVRPGIWGAVIGAIVLAIVGLSTGLLVTSSAAQTMASRQSEQAVITALTPFCVADFKRMPQQEQQTDLAALKKQESWNLGDYVKKQSWATMPDGRKPDDSVASACASKLLTLAKK